MNSAAGVQTTAAAAVTQPHSLDTNPLQDIAHELRQPLSAIESIAYYLSLVLPKGEVRAREQVLRLQQLVEQSNWILNCGLDLQDKDPVLGHAIDLEELITQAAAARSAHGDPYPHLELVGGVPLVQMDPGRGRALIENLFALFHTLAGTHSVRLSTSLSPRGVCLKLETEVQGYRSEANLCAGCSLSLASARRTVAAHGGTFDLCVDPASGIILTVVLP
jgi:signal transduction histidine kinase